MGRNLPMEHKQIVLEKCHLKQEQYSMSQFS